MWWCFDWQTEGRSSLRSWWSRRGKLLIGWAAFEMEGARPLFLK
jgi:hypothetical protein